MNLQMLSIQAFMKNGGNYKDEPIFQNVVFDVGKLECDIDDKIRILKKSVNNSRKNLYKISDFNSIRLPDQKEYDTLVDKISNLLFDDMS